MKILSWLFPNGISKQLEHISSDDVDWNGLLEGLEGSILVATSIDRMFRNYTIFLETLGICKQRNILLVILLPPLRLVKKGMVAAFGAQLGIALQPNNPWDHFICEYLELRSDRQILVLMK